MIRHTTYNWHEAEFTGGTNFMRAWLFHSSLPRGITSDTGKPVVINSAMHHFLGYSEEEIAKLTFDQITHTDYISIDQHLFNEIQKGRRTSYSINKKWISKKGKEVCGKLTVYALKATGTKGPFVAFEILALSKREFELGSNPMQSRTDRNGEWDVEKDWSDSNLLVRAFYSVTQSKRPVEMALAIGLLLLSLWLFWGGMSDLLKLWE